MDWKQIITNVVIGAILGGAGIFFVFQERITKSETRIDQLQKMLEQSETARLSAVSPTPGPTATLLS